MDLTKIKEMLENISQFFSEYSQRLLDPSSEPASKQVYFLDATPTIKQHLSFLKQVATEATFPEDIKEDAKLLYDQFQKVTEKFRAACLTINPDVTAEDTTVQLSEEAIKKAAQSNQTTQKLVNDISTLEKQQAAQSQIASLSFNYALVMDGQAVYFQAKDKQEAAEFIAAETAKKNPKTVSAFEVSFKQLKLTTKTVVTLE